MDQDRKVRENRLRRAAKRQGYIVEKSRRRDPRAVDFGYFIVTGPDDRAPRYYTIDELERLLTDGC
jgi:hypothetical protein